MALRERERDIEVWRKSNLLDRLLLHFQKLPLNRVSGSGGHVDTTEKSHVEAKVAQVAIALLSFSTTFSVR